MKKWAFLLIQDEIRVAIQHLTSTLKAITSSQPFIFMQLILERKSSNFLHRKHRSPIWDDKECCAIVKKYNFYSEFFCNPSIYIFKKEKILGILFV